MYEKKNSVVGILVDPMNGRSVVESRTRFALKEIRMHVKGDFSTLPLQCIRDGYSDGTYIFYANDSGLMLNLDVNFKMKPFLHEERLVNQYVGAPWGPVLILKRNEKSGKNLSMTNEEVERFLNENTNHIY